LAAFESWHACAASIIFRFDEGSKRQVRRQRQRLDELRDDARDALGRQLRNFRDAFLKAWNCATWFTRCPVRSDPKISDGIARTSFVARPSRRIPRVTHRTGTSSGQRLVDRCAVSLRRNDLSCG
jgi:hypothetical protein